MSVKTQIIGRLMDICQPLLAEGKFRKIIRCSAPALTEAVKPSIHLVIGDEQQTDEDTRGYNLEFLAGFDLILAESGDVYGLADEAVAFLQEKIESDLQLMSPDGSGFCRSLLYQREEPYTTDVTRAVTGTLVTYLIQYRRDRGNPNQNY